MQQAVDEAAEAEGDGDGGEGLRRSKRHSVHRMCPTLRKSPKSYTTLTSRASARARRGEPGNRPWGLPGEVGSRVT